MRKKRICPIITFWYHQLDMQTLFALEGNNNLGDAHYPSFVLVQA